MKVLVAFIIETEDYGKLEFKKEIEHLIKDIDKETRLLDFEMLRTKEDTLNKLFEKY